MKRKYVTWTKEMREQLKELARSGLTIAQAAETMGMGFYSVQKATRRYGISFGHKCIVPNRWSKEEDRILIETAESGKPARVVMEATGRSNGSVRSRARKLKVRFGKGKPGPLPAGEWEGNERVHPQIEREREYGKRPRKCLMGDMHEFMAKTDQNGRFLEYSCPKHRARPSAWNI